MTKKEIQEAKLLEFLVPKAAGVPGDVAGARRLRVLAELRKLKGTKCRLAASVLLLLLLNDDEITQAWEEVKP